MAQPELFDLSSHSDKRGTFTRTFDVSAPSNSGFSVAQVNISSNPEPFTLRGLHFQLSGPSEEKRICLLSGSAFLVVVDLREECPTFLQQYTFELKSPLATAIHVPSRFATGWMSTSRDTTFQYLMSARFEDCSYGGLRFDDPALAIKWPREPGTISENDLSWPPFHETFGKK
jgi:dTDP-4-dehydrorhamnose 3,5-epimerase